MKFLMRTPSAILLSIAITCASVPVASAASYSSFWSLGDSLSDPGNLYQLTGGAEPVSPPYYQGRFSNGPVWAEHVAADFTAKGLETDNYAYGFARAVTNLDDPIPDLGAQFDAFAEGSAGRLGARPIVSMWIGANDLIFRGVPEGRAAMAGRQAARAVIRAARALPGLGIKDVLMFDLPNLGDVPLYALGSDPVARERATRGSLAYNRVLARQIPGLEKAGLNVIRFDTAGLFAALLDNPEAFGVSDATTPCLIPGQLPCTPEQALERAFFDPVHPNSVIHQVIADIVRTEVAPVPVPPPAALLITALAGIGLVKRGRLWSHAA